MADAKRPFLKAILKNIEEQLVALSFYKTQGAFFRELDKDSVGYVGLNVATHLPQDRIGVAPIVGVRYLPVEDLIQKLCRAPLSRYEVTLATAIGYVTPENRFLQWVFDPTMPEIVDSEIGKMMRAIRDFGVPFMQEHADPESILAELELKRYTVNDLRRYRLPVTYLLGGRREEAQNLVEQELEAMKGRTDPAATQYRDFAKSVREWQPGK